MLSKKFTAIAGAVAEATDDYFENVTMLLHGDGTNGAQNNTFLDSSTANSGSGWTITRNGNTTQGSFSPYGPTWSNYFNGSSDYLGIPDNAAMEWGSSSLTLEMWVFTGATTQYTTIMAREPLAFQTGEWALQVNQSGASSGNVGLFVWDYNSGSPLLSSTGVNVCDNKWHHIAVVRNVNAWTLYVDGVSVATNTWSGTVADLAYGTVIGRSDYYGRYFPGYISNVRLVKGGALYTSNFTPNTAPLSTTVSSGTVSLLTCQSNRFVDSSASPLTITVNGSPSVQRFSPFNPTAAYSTATIGGSGYFDGSGDYLSAASNDAFALGTGDFEVDFWFYPTVSSQDNFDKYFETGASSGNFVIDQQSTANQITVNDNNTVLLSSSSTITPFAWNYVTVSRLSGTLRIFLNGTQVGSVSNSTNFTQAGAFIGATASGTQNVTGYFADVRVVKGSGVSSVTVPTSPLTAITNTSLLANMTNAGIYDNAMMNDLETVGNAQISTTQKKYGTASMYFDYSASYLTSPFVASQNLSTGDFTIEMWAYWSSLASTTGLFNKSYTTDGNTWQGMHAFVSTSGTINFETNDTLSNGATGARISASSNVSTGTWYHIAFVRSAGTTKIYLNGTSVGSGSNSGSCDNTYGFVVAKARPNTTWYMNGYIDDFRITKGYARYTSNFTAPTAALPNK